MPLHRQCQLSAAKKEKKNEMNLEQTFIIIHNKIISSTNETKKKESTMKNITMKHLSDCDFYICREEK